MAVEVETEKAKSLSVIVPVYQEPQDEMKSLLAWIEENSDWRVEWIIVGAIGDQSFESVVSEIRDFAGMSRIVSSRLKTRAEVNVIVAPRGRSKQMNAGAKQASGQILLFLHADTRLAKGWIDSIEGAIREARSSWGAFSPGIEEEGVVYRIAERWGLWRSRGLGLPYGDQAMFIDIRLFWKLGGFDETVQFMEEVELARKLCRSGKWPIILPEVAATSGRRWRGHGIWQSARNIVAFLLYMAGIPRESIRRWYSG